jgi:hypothetical protein
MFDGAAASLPCWGSFYVNLGPLPKGKLGKRAKYKKLGFLPLTSDLLKLIV